MLHQPAKSTLLVAALAVLPLARAAADTPAPAPEARAAREAMGERPSRSHAMVLGRGKRGYLGLQVLELTPELRRHFQAGEDAGVLVAKVEAASPAAKAGVEVGDVLVAIDGKPAVGGWDLRRLLAPHGEGDAIPLDVVRGGHRQRFTATLVEREGEVVELGQLLRRGGSDESVLVFPAHQDWQGWEAFGESMGALGEHLGSSVERAFNDPGMRLRVEHEMHSREDLQRKLDRLEQRLRELERRLGEQKRR